MLMIQAAPAPQKSYGKSYAAVPRNAFFHST